MTNQHVLPPIETVSPPEPETPQKREWIGKAGRWAGGIILAATAMTAGGLTAIEFGPANHIDIAGVDVSVKPKLGQDYTQIDGAVKRPEHTSVLGKPIGLKIDGDWNKLAPSDKTIRQDLNQMFDDPAPEIDRIESAAKNYLLEKGAAGAGGVLLAGLLIGSAVRIRRQHYDALSDDRKEFIDNYNRGLRKGVALAGIIAVGSLYATAGGVLAHHAHHEVVGSPSLNGTPLEGTEVSGLAGKVLPFFSLLEPKSTFYDDVSKNLEATLKNRPELKKDDDSVVFVVADDFEDVNGMARQVGITAKDLKADFIGLTGDLTFAGNQLETSIIDTVNHYSDDTPVEFEPGLHDTSAIVNTAEDRGWQVGDNKIHDIAGLKILTTADPRISEVGQFGAGDKLRDPDVSLSQFENDIAKEACDEHPDIIIGHDHLALQPAAETGCAPAVIAGREFDQLPIQSFTTDDGTSVEFTAGSGGGHKTTNPNPGRIQNPATYEIFKVDKTTGVLRYAVVTVNPDAAVSISEMSDLAYLGNDMAKVTSAIQPETATN